MKGNEKNYYDGQPENWPLQRGRTDGSKFFTPLQLAARWGWHAESIRRAIRDNRIAAIVISRRLLIPVQEVERVEREGLLPLN